MSLLLVVAAAALLGTTLLLARREWQLMRQCREQAFDVVAARERLAELGRILSQRERLAKLQGLSEEAVDDVTGVVRTVHKGIASVPFAILESIPATRDTTRMVREIHDLTSDSVYGGIRGLNRWLGGGVRRGLDGDDGSGAGSAAGEEERKP